MLYPYFCLGKSKGGNHKGSPLLVSRIQVCEKDEFIVTGAFYIFVPVKAYDKEQAEL